MIDRLYGFGIMFNSLVSYTIFYLFLLKKYGFQRSKMFYAISFAAVISLNISTNMLQINILNFVISFISQILVAYVVFRCDLTRSIIYTVTFMLISMTSEFVSVAMFSYIYNLSPAETVKDPNLILMISFSDSLLLFVFFHMLTAIFSKGNKYKSRPEEIFMYIFILFLELFIAVEYSLSITDKYENIKLLIILVGFLFIDIYFVVSMMKISENNQVKHENQLLQKQNEIQLAHYKELENTYSESRKVIHDIKKHLAILSELKSEAPEKAQQYRKMIEDDVDSLIDGFKCSNKILSIVMSQKIAAAEAHNIEVVTDIEDITFDFMNDLDITAIFANLWDNAIEACEKCTQKYIEINMESRSGFILINFKNSYTGKLNKTNSGYNTTKSGHSGVGLNIIRSTVKKYGGLINIETQNSDFIVELTIPIPINI